MSCITYIVESCGHRSKKSSFEREANARAAELGFLTNQEIFRAPINIPQKTSLDIHGSGQLDFVECLCPGKEDEPEAKKVVGDLQILHRDFYSEILEEVDPALLVMDEYRDYIQKGGREEQVRIPKGSRLLMFSHAMIPIVCGNEWNRLRRLGCLLSAPLVDRTETLSSGLHILNRHPVFPFDEQWSMSLDTIMLKRAEQILELSKTDEQKDIHILWSGGIDTTASVCSFLRVTERPEWQEYRDRLVITYCERSKNENPRFYEQFIKNKLRELPIQGHVRDIIDGRRIVTGDPADMIFGTFAMANCLVPYIDGKINNLFTRLDDPWREVFPIAIEQSKIILLPGEKTDDWVQWIEPFVEKCPIKVYSWFDFLWWGAFGMKYQHDLFRIFYNRKSLTKDIVDSVTNFYDTYDFHQWSYHNHHLKMTDHSVWGSYKAPLKKFIFDFNKDEEYYRTKIKVVSVNNSWGMEVGIDEHLNVIRFGKYSISIKRMREKYGNSLYTFRN